MKRIGIRLLSAAVCALALLAAPRPASALAPEFRLPDSDLRLCWDTAGTPVSCAGTGQDGAYANTSPTANGLSYTISTDTVFDNNTGLTWQRGGDGLTYTWEAAKAACTSLNLGGFATGWRLPSKKELAGIIDYAIPAPGPVFASAFTNSFASYYWTSTPLADGSGLYAWGAYIPWGNIAASDKNITPMYVRCVRGNEYGNTTGTAPVRPQLAVNANRTVTDARTGLTWQQDESGTQTWDQALGYCNALTLAGLEWRLPNIKELESLIDDTRYAPAVDPTAFPNAVQWLYWSSTSYPAVPSALWRIDFTTGFIDGYPKSGAAINVKCVSGPVSTHLLTVQSTYPAAGVAITVTPADVNAAGNGSTTFTRSYDPGTLVTLTAPASADGNPFAGWTGCTGTSGTTCSVTMNSAKTVTANYTRDAVARPMTSALWSRSDDGRAALWKVDPVTGVLQEAVQLNAGAGVGAPWLATSYQQVDASTGYVLWTRSDTGKAFLWKINPATGARTASVSVGSAVGGPWQATSYAHVGASAGYVLWTRSDTGQAVLWKIDPATGARLGLVTLGAAAGIGAPWQATSYVHAGPTTGYVLWTRTDMGQAVLWTVDPGTGARTRMAVVTPDANASWLAAGYEQTSATSGQVLWTRSDTGAAVIWTIDPSVDAPSKGATIWLNDGTTSAYPAALVGAPWQATAYAPVNNVPTVGAVANQTVDPDAPLTVTVGGIGSGDAGQSVSVTAVSSDPTLVPDPSVSYTSPSTTATLTFTPVPGAFGTATITVWISDGQAANSPVSTSFTLTFNDPPTDIALSSRLADAGLPAGTAVGAFTTTDPNAGDSFTYALVAGAGDNASFALAGSNGSQLLTNAVLDYTARTSYSVVVRSTDRAGASVERTLTIVPPAYTLWTRGDTGQAQLWQVDPDTGARGSSVALGPSAGVGGPWLATSFARVDSTTGYVLWSRNDTGQSVLWKVDPSTGAWLRTVTVGASAGVGAPWLATSFVLADPATGYVMWTRSDTGQGVVSRLDLTNFDTVTSIPRGKPKSIFKKEGTGGPWQATSLMLADPTTAYVLWSRSDNGRAVLWRVDFTNYDTLDVLPVPPDGWANVGASTGVGAPWLATGYEQTATNAGHVLWTRSDLGQAIVWSVDPGTLPAAILQVAPLQQLHTGAGMGSPWQATSHVRP